MAIAIFAPVVRVLERAGVVHQAGGQTVLDVQGYIYLTKEGKRWNDLGLEVPSARVVQISSTDIRKSNSAAMYLSLLAWAIADKHVMSMNFLDSESSDFLDSESLVFLDLESLVFLYVG